MSDRHTLVVMRHAKTEPASDDDHARDLTKSGRRDAHAAGAWLADKGLVPDHAYVSSAQRTRTTWAAIAEAAKSHAEPTYDDALYSAGPETVIDVLRSAPDDANVVLYVGHNPTAAMVAHLLDDGNPDPDAFRQMSQGYPTSAIAVLELDGSWSELAEATGHLVDFHVARG